MAASILVFTDISCKGYMILCRRFLSIEVSLLEREAYEKVLNLLITLITASISVFTDNDYKG